MRHKAVIVLFLILLGIGFWQGCQNSPPVPDCPPPKPCPPCPSCPPAFQLPTGPTGPQAFKEQTLLDKINEVRGQKGLNRLKFDWRLYLAASLQVQILAARCADRDSCTASYGQCWENHQCPGQPSFEERLKWAGWAGWPGHVFEIAQGGSGYLGTDDLIQGWLDSPPHKAAMLGSTWTAGACSFHRLHRGWLHIFAVCVFGKED